MSGRSAEYDHFRNIWKQANTLHAQSLPAYGRYSLQWMFGTSLQEFPWACVFKALPCMLVLGLRYVYLLAYGHYFLCQMFGNILQRFPSACVLKALLCMMFSSIPWMKLQTATIFTVHPFLQQKNQMKVARWLANRHYIHCPSVSATKKSNESCMLTLVTFFLPIKKKIDL